MGNTFCKHRVGVDEPSRENGKVNNCKPQSSIDKIISRVQLCPRSFTRHPDDKQKINNPSKRTISYPSSTPIVPVHATRTRKSSATLEKSQSVATITPASSEWMEVALEVPDSPPQKQHFTENKGTPVPPPRKHRKKLREKIENITKNVINGLQSSNVEQRIPVEEPIITKTVVKRHICDIDELRCHNHLNNNHHGHANLEKHKPALKIHHQKHHSTVSLPNYNELQLSVPKPPENDRSKSPSRNSSAISLPGEAKKTSSVLETYMTRCRSFGSLLPYQILEKLKSRRVVSDTAESDDSWGGLEDWDLGVIEHYKPHDNSLPRPIKHQDEISAKFMIGNTELEKRAPPVPPVRRSDSLQKKLNQENSETKRNSIKESQKDFLTKFLDDQRDHSSIPPVISQQYALKDIQQDLNICTSSNPFICDPPKNFDNLHENMNASETNFDKFRDLANLHREITSVPPSEVLSDAIDAFDGFTDEKLPKICSEIAKNDEHAEGSIHKELMVKLRDVDTSTSTKAGLKTPPSTPDVAAEIDEVKFPALHLKTFDEIKETVNEHSGLMKIINVMAHEVGDEENSDGREKGASKK